MKLFPPSYSYHITIYTLKIIFLENEEHNNIFMKNIMNLVLIFLIILLTSKANSYNLYEFNYTFTSSSNSEKIEYATYQGTPLLIDIFATWCEPCKTEILHLKEIHDKTSDISFLSISIDFISDTLQKLENFKEEFEVDWEFGLDHNDIFSQISI
ncbi:MAG: TlpA family protein disulfide reductase [Candidatus Kariarchaeum pelagius]